MSILLFEEAFGPKRFLIWSKSNNFWRIFYRTTVAGHWDKGDVEEFNKCGYFYEIHLSHGQDDVAHSFCLSILERCDTFKAAKVSNVSVNDMKVIVFAGKDKKMKNKIAHAAKHFGFKLDRIRSKDDQRTTNESKLDETYLNYITALEKAFSPNLRKRRG